MSRMRAGSAAPVVSYALSRGLTMIEIQEATGVSCKELMAPEGRLPDSVVPQLWLLMSSRFPKEPLTLDMARAAPFSFFGGLADGAQFADDLRSAIGLLVSNSQIISDRMEVTFEEGTAEPKLVSHHPLDAVDGGRSAEMGIALAVRLIREFLGVENSIASVRLAHAPHCAKQHYVEFFKVPIEFEASETALILNADALSSRIQYANVQLFSYVNAHFAGVRTQIAASNTSDTLSALRKAVAQNALAGEFGAAAAAAAANMSLRTAQRLTAEHGHSLQSLIEDIREHRAREFLSDLRIDVTSIALLLGYSDDRAFRRAFLRWTGQTPSDFRNAVRKSRE
ncbi:MAG: AraC family transcriptional regulator ligand-binding domain-containing protein [Pseudomonadota bacterium]